MRAGAILTITLMMTISSLALGDEPLPPATAYDVCSPSGRYCLHLDPQTDQVELYEAADEANRIWTVTGWTRDAFVNDEGVAFLIVYRDLIPLDIEKDETIIYVAANGQIVRTYSLTDIVADQGALEQTESHYFWGTILGVSDGGLCLEIKTVENKTLCVSQ